MKKLYIFLIPICIIVYLLYLIIDYKYREFQISRYREHISTINMSYSKKIQEAELLLKTKTSKAYKNKILKTEQAMKSPGEVMIQLISEEKYNTYTQTWSETTEIQTQETLGLFDEKSLIQSMTIYQRWVYLILWKDIR